MDRTLPILKPNFEDFNSNQGLSITWIGHATVLIKLDGLTVLTDPIWSKRCSPSQFFGPARYRELPCTVEELPNIDAVVISHSHYDHMDLWTIKALNKRFGNKLSWFVPLENRSWMIRQGCEVVTELDWWEEGTVASHPEIKFVCSPAQHLCQRNAFDRNKVSIYIKHNKINVKI